MGNFPLKRSWKFAVLTVMVMAASPLSVLCQRTCPIFQFLTTGGIDVSMNGIVGGTLLLSHDTQNFDTAPPVSPGSFYTNFGTYEGVLAHVYPDTGPGLVPLYIFSFRHGGFYYTASESEKDVIITLIPPIDAHGPVFKGWVGYVSLVPGPNLTPLFHVLQPAGFHVYTIDPNVRNAQVANGAKDYGIVAYLVNKTDGTCLPPFSPPAHAAAHQRRSKGRKDKESTRNE
jgi:hypothetical protein